MIVMQCVFTIIWFMINHVIDEISTRTIICANHRKRASDYKHYTRITKAKKIKICVDKLHNEVFAEEAPRSGEKYSENSNVGAATKENTNVEKNEDAQSVYNGKSEKLKEKKRKYNRETDGCIASNVNERSKPKIKIISVESFDQNSNLIINGQRDDTVKPCANTKPNNSTTTDDCKKPTYKSIRQQDTHCLATANNGMLVAETKNETKIAPETKPSPTRAVKKTINLPLATGGKPLPIYDNIQSTDAQNKDLNDHNYCKPSHEDTPIIKRKQTRRYSTLATQKLTTNNDHDHYCRKTQADKKPIEGNASVQTRCPQKKSKIKISNIILTKKKKSANTESGRAILPQNRIELNAVTQSPIEKPKEEKVNQITTKIGTGMSTEITTEYQASYNGNYTDNPSTPSYDIKSASLLRAEKKANNTKELHYVLLKNISEIYGNTVKLENEPCINNNIVIPLKKRNKKTRKHNTNDQCTANEQNPQDEEYPNFLKTRKGDLQYGLRRNIYTPTPKYNNNNKRVKELNIEFGKKGTHKFFTGEQMQKINFYSILPPKVLNKDDLKATCNHHTEKIKNYLLDSSTDFESLFAVLTDLPESFAGLPISCVSDFYKKKVEEFFNSYIHVLKDLYPEMQFFMDFYDIVKKREVQISEKNAYASLCFLHLLPIILDAMIIERKYFDDTLNINENKEKDTDGKYYVDICFNRFTQYAFISDNTFAMFLFLLLELIPESLNTRLRIFYQIRHRALFESYIVKKNDDDLEINSGTDLSNRLLRMTPYCFLYLDGIEITGETVYIQERVFYLDVFLDESRYYMIATNKYQYLKQSNMNFFVKIFRIFLIQNKNKISESIVRKLHKIDSYFELKMQNKKMCDLKKESKNKCAAAFPLRFIKNFMPDASENFYADYNTTNCYCHKLTDENVLQAERATVYHVVYYILFTLCNKIIAQNITTAFMYKLPMSQEPLEKLFLENYNIIRDWKRWSGNHPAKASDCYEKYAKII